MAVAYVVLSSVADTDFLDLQPAGMSEIVIHNIYTPEGKAYELYWYDGANSIKFDNDVTSGRGSIRIHCTNSIFVRVKNVSGGAILIGADGIYSR